MEAQGMVSPVISSPEQKSSFSLIYLSLTPHIESTSNLYKLHLQNIPQI